MWAAAWISLGSSLLSGRGLRSGRSGCRPACGSGRAEGRLHRVGEGRQTPGPRSRRRACPVRGLLRRLRRAGCRLLRTTAASHLHTAARTGRAAPSAPRRAVAARRPGPAAAPTDWSRRRATTRCLAAPCPHAAARRAEGAGTRPHELRPASVPAGGRSEDRSQSKSLNISFEPSTPFGVVA
jgi:hypothetical protein